ncbi:MAG: hypothetical protein ACRDPV_10560 [Gaiellaceae bacterium]
MKRAALIAAGVLGALVIAGVAGWLVLLRDEAEPVTVAEALTSFRTDTEPTPGAPSPIPEGVYVYATAGYERTDALTGVTHRYPKRSTITISATDCGVSLLWRVLKGRTTKWIYCTTPAGWELASQDERHTFFGRTEPTTYLCTGLPIRPAAGSVTRWSVACATDTSEEHGVGSLVGREPIRVGGQMVTAEHVRRTSTFSGEIRGSSRHDLWFDSESGVPVKIAMVSRTTNDSRVGAVHYEEDVTLLLTSLTPRR